MSILQEVAMVGAGVVATMLTRFIPFLLFRPGKPTPRYITYLGKVLPASVFALLVVFCLKDTISIEKWRLAFSQDAILQFAAVAVTFLVHAWRRNIMWSIATGTITYMLLIRCG